MESSQPDCMTAWRSTREAYHVRVTATAAQGMRPGTRVWVVARMRLATGTLWPEHDDVLPVEGDAGDGFTSGVGGTTFRG